MLEPTTSTDQGSTRASIEENPVLLELGLIPDLAVQEMFDPEVCANLLKVYAVGKLYRQEPVLTTLNRAHLTPSQTRSQFRKIFFAVHIKLA